MSHALSSMAVPLLIGLLLLLAGPGPIRRWGGYLTLAVSLASGLAAWLALESTAEVAQQEVLLGDWEEGLAIRLELTALSALLLLFTALIHGLVALYAQFSRHGVSHAYWPLSCLLHATLAALWLSGDLFNLYVTLELLGLTSVALLTQSGSRAWKPALDYLVLSLAASLCYLLGVAMLYGQYGVLDIALLSDVTENSGATQLALVLMTGGLMLKAAMWPLHGWLPAAHASAPTAVSALLSALVVKGPLFILWRLWSEVAPVDLAVQSGPLFAAAGIAALTGGGYAALRSPYIKTLVAYSTVAQMGYAMMALGLLLYWQHPQMHIALWLFVIAHGLAKASLFMAAGEIQNTLGTRRISGLRGATQTAPIAMFAFAVAGGSLIGLPPSGGFLSKWVLLGPLLNDPWSWPWAAGVFLGTLVSAAYVFRAVVMAFDRVHVKRANLNPDRTAQWLAMLPALLVWAMALNGSWLVDRLAGGGI
jgi:formate hydrogenlyase subunit 3/multisubunit Na+/H+ antiporter MnhD subunit